MALPRGRYIDLEWKFWAWALLLVAVLAAILHDEYYRAWTTPKCHYDSAKSLKQVHNLSIALQERLFGQPLATRVLINGLYAHHKAVHPQKALVMSFHGPQGTGKTLASQLIAEHLFDGGFANPHVHFFLGPKHFLLDKEKLVENKEFLRKKIESARQACERPLFIFDEVDKMPGQILDVLVPYIDHHRVVDGVDYRGLTFIFLTNSVGSLIKQATGTLLSGGHARNQIDLLHFSDLIAKNAYTEKGGLILSEMIWKSLVDYYVPFMPLEKEHVIKCAKRAILDSNTLFITGEQIAEKVEYTCCGGSVKFANDGCKTVRSLINFYAEEYYAMRDKDDI